jgi:hypothetical protein
MTAFEIPWHPSVRTLRQFGGLWLVATGLLAWRFGVTFNTIVPLAIAAVAAAIGVSGLLWPCTIRPLFVALMVLTAPIGWAVSNVLLTIVFLGLFTPMGLVFRILGRDAMKRGFDTESETYWQPKVMPADPARYLRAF